MASPFITTFVVLCILGLLNSGYLVWKHRKNSKTPLVCPLDHDCSKVTESKWSKMLGIRNEVLGTLFYAGLLIFFLLNLSGWRFKSFTLLLFLATLLSSLFSLLLIYIQIRIIKDYCFYCLLSALINFLLLINSLILKPGLPGL